jgi:hypothetical protein
MLETTAIVATALKRTDPTSHRKADVIAWLTSRLEWEDRLAELTNARRATAGPDARRRLRRSP